MTFHWQYVSLVSSRMDLVVWDALIVQNGQHLVVGTVLHARPLLLLISHVVSAMISYFITACIHSTTGRYFFHRCLFFCLSMGEGVYQSLVPGPFSNPWSQVFSRGGGRRKGVPQSGIRTGVPFPLARPRIGVTPPPPPARTRTPGRV